jgi:2,3-bisphosphoglycerate-independent phosphoglycerate mutase
MDQDFVVGSSDSGSALLSGCASRGGQELAAGVRERYAAGQTDYAIEPLVLADSRGQPVGRIADGDAVIFCLRRGEREIELTEAFTEPDFAHFSRPAFQHLDFVILTLYHEKFKDLPVAFLPTQIPETLGEVVSRAGLRQLHISESEKFAHVTFFLNGGQHQPFPGEDDVCIPSPRDIPFDQVPALSLPQVAGEVVEGIRQGYDLIVANFANGDVIGHTASRQAKLECAASVDAQLARVVQAAEQSGYVTLITADHGNLETLWNEDGTPHVAHTANPVAFILVDPLQPAPLVLRSGKLADVAPTLLSALGVAQPSAMDGVSLAPGAAWGGKRKVLLLILDGWGMGAQDDTNPIFQAPTPFWDGLLLRCPSSRLQASGEAVGLQAGKAGNSEAGHLNLGAGRVVLQDDVRLDLAMKDGSFETNQTFLHVMDETARRKSSLHLIALLSEKSSHGSIAYPLVLLRMAKARRLAQVFVHVIFDGRSTEPGSAPALLEKLETEMQSVGLGQIVTGMGRGIALDRDGNYGKIQRAYEALVLGTGRKVSAAV